MMSLLLIHALALHGVNYWEIRCNEEWALHKACEIVQPSPLTNGEGFDTCYNHWVMCHVRMMED